MKRVFILFAILMAVAISILAEEPFFAVTNKKNVNMRARPDSSSSLVMQIKTKGTRLTVFSSSTDKKGATWLEVETQLGKRGFIKEEFLTKVEGKPIIKVNGKYTSWSDAYQDFIIGGKYKNWRGPDIWDQIWDDLTPRFGLYDIDQNGIPELLAGGNEAMASNCYHIFTFSDGNLQFCGNAGFESATLYTIPNSEYIGLFCHDGKQDIYATHYYPLVNGKIKDQRVRVWRHHWIQQENGEYINNPGDPIKLTDDDNLYNLTFTHDVTTLIQYTRSEIQRMGWDAFLVAPFWKNVYVETWVYPDCHY